MNFWVQLSSVLRKNLLTKWRNIWGTLLEIWLPVLFVSLLIMIKGLTDTYNSPNVDYTCGQSEPFNYASDSASFPTLATCMEEPPACSANHYYRGDHHINGSTLYKHLGYVDSDSSYPLYTLTVGDPSSIYTDGFGLDNPSLPFPTIMERMAANRAILGVSPKVDDNSDLVTATSNLVTHLKTLVNETVVDSIVLFSSKKSMDDYMTNRHYEDDDYKQGKVGMAIVVNEGIPLSTTGAIQWDYSIRMNFSYFYEQTDDQVACLYPDGNDCDFTYSVPTTQFYTNDLYKPQIMDDIYGYSFSGFSALQKVVDEYILSRDAIQFSLNTTLSLMPTTHYKTDNFQYVISSTLPLFYMLSFLYPVSRMIKSVVADKEDRIKEGMKMMGLTDLAYNASWFITLTVQLAITCLLITVIAGPTVFEYSNKNLVFLYFFIFSIAVMMMCFLISTLFNKAKTASLLGTLIFFAAFFPYYSVVNAQISTGTKTATCLLAPSCFALGANVFADWEGGLAGVQTDNASTETSNFSYTLMIVMLSVDALVYGLLALYLDLVLPSEFGTQLPLNFFLLPSFWQQTFCPDYYNASSEKEGDIGVSLLSDEEKGGEYDEEEDDVNIEDVGEELQRQLQDGKGVKIRKLRKVFETTGSEDRVAVNSLNFDMFEGQITVLLGHNGAGKSTTINMLTGLIPPTSGGADVLGMPITKEMRDIRRIMGVCPQHDVLFPSLTVREHLQIFAKVKGVESEHVDDEVESMIREVGLKEKIDVQSSMLSGGMKRKLSVGIAMIGGSKVVVLDEPTSGMDPYSRRSTWNVIRRMKQGRIILLTTHFLDEADILGDRIAIMGDGKLRCMGSSLYLKAQYGVGYTLTITKSGETDVDHEIERAATDCGGMVTSSVGTELSLRLPFESSAQFPELFTKIDQRGIEYGISVTTLEEVFMRVGRGVKGDVDDVTRKSIARLSSLRSSGYDLDEEKGGIHGDIDVDRNGSSVMHIESDGEDESSNHFYSKTRGREMERKVFWNHLKALLNKRMIYGLRDKRVFICQLLLPFLLVLLGLVLLLLAPSTDQPALSLTEKGPKQLNKDYTVNERNFVPFTPLSTTADQVMSQITYSSVETYAKALEVTSNDLSSNDPFDGCSHGIPTQTSNLSNFLVSTFKNGDNFQQINEKGASRYGAIVAGGDTTNFYSQNLVNGSNIHGAGMYPNLISNSLIKVVTGDPTSYIKVTNHPLPRTNAQETNTQTADGFTAATFIMIAMCFLPASYAAFVVKEREVKAKHQQIISGVSLGAYWTSTFLWDSVSYLVPCALILALIFSFQIDAFTKNDGALAVFLLFLLYGPAVASFTYMISFFFKNHSTAQNTTLFLHFLTGLCLMITSFVLTLVDSTTSTNNTLRYFYRLFPTYCLGDGLSQIAICDDGKHCPKLTSDGYSSTATVSPFAFNTAGGNIIYLAIESIAYFLITVFVEYLHSFPQFLAFLHSVNDPGDEYEEIDEDVIAEENRVLSGGAEGDIVRLNRLRKVYPSPGGPKVAVKSLTFGIPKGECFGFLGINGAGKTTTLSILSGEFPPTQGTASIAGFDILLEQTKLRRKIGYCPQFDALLELLTVREHLELYAKIKGILPERIDDTINYLIETLDLSEYHDKAAGSLSGGNKRKLSVAISMIGEPPIIFLDEPSTGMDPLSRRRMWEVIAGLSTKQKKAAIILTTHSMEESEALCSRIGIMVNGRLRCLGSTTHLRQRFGQGFEVDIQLHSPSSDELSSILPENLPTVIVPGDVERVCSLFGDSNRAQLIQPNQPGALIHDILTNEEQCQISTFAEWWIGEDRADNLAQFMVNTFESSKLLERSTSTSFRYRIQSTEMTLAQIFTSFENSRTDLCTKDYSVGQTTLEQIFNQFASSQDNPEVQ